MLLLPSPPGSPREPGPTCPPASSACPPQPSGSRGHGDGDGGGIITRARSAECKKKLKDKSNHACKASGDKFITAEEVQCKWNQHGSHLNIQLVSSGAVRLKDLSVILSNRGCSVAFPGGFVWRCTFYGEIEASCSKVQCRERDRQLILNLQKKREHEDWPTLSIAGKVLTGQTTIQDRNKMCLVRNYQPLPVHIKGSLKADISKEHVDEVGKPGGCVSVWSINKNWYKKSAEVMVVNVYLKQVQRDRFRVTFSPYHLTVVFQTRDERFLKQHENATPESRFQWTLELLHVIDPEQSSYTLRTSYLEISLRKKDGQRWKPTDEPFCKTPEESLPPRSPTEARKAAPAVGAAAGPVRGSATHHVLADLPEHCTSQSSESATACTAKPMCKVPPIMASSGGEGEEAEQVCVPGFTGLVNLGNTCFMNSVIQALSNTRELRDYLHDSAFKADINYSNVLGTGGRLAVSFAIILRTLWKGTHYAFSPSKLKEIVSNKASQFSGFSQHDAQEFLAFLLDGLHEDLNLAANTPTPQQYPEPHGSLSDQHMAERAWARHKAWNDSFIVHLFHGLYKSKLVCPVCGHVSITFDPFLYLPVPLPQRQRVLPVYFLPREPYRRPVKLSVRVRQVNAHGTDVIKFVAERMKVHPDNLKLVQVNKARFERFVQATTSLEQVGSSDMVFCCEVLSRELAGERVRVLPVKQRRKIPDKPVTHCANCQKTSPLHLRLRRCMNCYRVGYCNLNCQRNHWVEHKSQCQPEAIGLPFLVSIPESRLTFHRLAQIMEAYARYSVNVFQPPVQPGTAFLQDPEYSSPSPTSSEVSPPPPSPASCSRQSNAEQPRLETQLPSEIDKEGQGLQASRPQATTRGEQRESGWENAEWAEELDSPLFKPILRQSDYPQADELKTLRGEDGVELKRDIGGGCHVLGHRRMQERVAAAASLVEARVESSSPHARVEEKDGSGTKKPLRPEVVLCATAAVHGLQQQDKSWQGWTPQFSIKVIENNVEKTLNHRGDCLLDIPDGAQLAMDWNNDSKQQGHVMVLPRELDCDEELPTEEHASSRDIKDSVSMPTSLHHCLKLFTKPETLTPEEAWLCPQCEQPREALKQLMLWRLPPVLVVQLKRFSFCSSVWREKISNLVTFPIRGLDLSEFCVEAASGGAGGDAGGAAVYDLYAAINHYGGLIGGHYTAYARLPCARNSQCSDMGWRWFDDSTVTMVNESQVMSRHAYLLFYRRRDCPLAPYRRRPAEAPWTPAPARQDPAEEIIILDEEEEEEKNDDWPVTLNSQNTRASTAPCSTETFSSRSTTKNSAD
ncbi:ubiquitin carboxyl-terminal hydrolase 19-like isoform X4 [Petromyzon marinus]|uniref:ubiquitin carboxyl-terminal hydrolase 19-like isoform X4 n=1 Tax=Petromyzon marinus TaxID=7757 RepID=UPI003F6E67C7